MSLISDADTLLQKRKRHKLPEQDYVTLSEALSWLAFNIPLKSGALATALEFGSPDKIAKARLHLIEAVDRLAGAASGGRIRMRGKPISRGFEEGKVRTQPIPPEAHHDFARFDVFCDGLNPGHGLAWRYSSEGLDTADNDQPEDAYRSIWVNRDELENFNKEKRAPSYKRGDFPDDDVLWPKINEMLDSGMEGYDVAKNIHRESGFENTPNTHVRKLIRGLKRPGPRKNEPAE